MTSMLFTGSAKKNAKKQVQLCAMILFKILALHKSFKIIKNLEMRAIRLATSNYSQ